MATKDEKGIIHYTPEELEQIPSFEVRSRTGADSPAPSGTVLGALGGAALGSAAGPVGTVIGGAAGAAVGSRIAGRPGRE
ncbi:MAG: hypothetical protein K0R39_3287 [Symbiobacteriaceae bacterium]|nr:hypothetical protein [Symbiobacteriaceae bacterium]